ncbi:MAG: hypothetical protein K0V04_27330 [Deltaproteobacteria bacterium]|nr:hypothetical protein [Deltaproteobacteria bacterium]
MGDRLRSRALCEPPRTGPSFSPGPTRRRRLLAALGLAALGLAALGLAALGLAALGLLVLASASAGLVGGHALRVEDALFLGVFHQRPDVPQRGLVDGHEVVVKRRLLPGRPSQEQHQRLALQHARQLVLGGDLQQLALGGALDQLAHQQRLLDLHFEVLLLAPLVATAAPYLLHLHLGHHVGKSHPGREQSLVANVVRCAPPEVDRLGRVVIVERGTIAGLPRLRVVGRSQFPGGTPPPAGQPQHQKRTQ